MTDASVVGYGLPVAPAPFERLANCAVIDGGRGFHAPIIVKHSLKSKEHFTNTVGHPRRMAEKTINQVVAENLKYWMDEAGVTQMALATKAGVSQKTISNYLNPDQRTEGDKGKQPSAKLTELDQVATALGIGVWQLTREMTPKERSLYEKIERAYAELIEPPASAHSSSVLQPISGKPARKATAKKAA